MSGQSSQGRAEDAAGAARHAHVVDAAEAGQRLDRLLAERLEGLTRSRLKRLIEDGRLTVDGAPVTEASTKARAGQSLALTVPPPAEARPAAQAIALAVVYEDADLIVVDKPAGLVMHPAPGNPDRTLVNALIAYCGESLRGVGGERRPGIVHRLDKDTSGLIVAAKTDAAHQGLVAQFAGREIERAYACLVWGVPAPRRGEIAGTRGRSPRNRKKMAVLRRGGRPAVTRYQVQRSYAGAAVSRLECRLLTGRTHQIRVHLSHIGHPLLGDPLYGRGARGRLRALPEGLRAALSDLGRQALHARLLGFRHPATDDWLSFESDLPQDLVRLTSALESL